MPRQLGVRRRNLMGERYRHHLVASGRVEAGSVRRGRASDPGIPLNLPTTLPRVELIDLPEFGPDDFDLVTGGEPDPFGTDHLGIEWLDKSDHLGLMDGGRLIGHAGWVASTVRTADGWEGAVLGLGGVMMHPDYRGHGVGAQLVEGAMARMRSGGPRLGILFCRPERLAFYGRLGWIPVTSEVTVDQPTGTIVMPLRTCWSALEEGASLPAGDLRVVGLPF